MDEYATKSDMRVLNNKIDKAVEDIASIIHDFSQQVANEFTKAKTERDELRASIDRLSNTLDGFAKRMEDVQRESAARDVQFDRLVDWEKRYLKKLAFPCQPNSNNYLQDQYA